LTALLSAACIRRCPGFLAHPVSESGGYQVSYWMPRLVGREGSLVDDLARALLSYRTVGHVSLEVLSQRSLDGSLDLRAQLTVGGRDQHLVARRDRGVIDLRLARLPAGWKVDDLRVVRVVTLRRAEAGYQAASTGLLAKGRTLDWRGSEERLPGTPPIAMAYDDVATGPILALARGRELWGVRVGPSSGDDPTLLLRADAEILCLRAADLDGDGVSEMLVGTDGGTTRFYRFIGGSLVPYGRWQVRGQVTDAVLADFDRDAILDLYLVVRAGRAAELRSGGEAAFYRGRGGGRFHAGVRGVELRRHHSACAGDLNQDGWIDLLLLDELGSPRIWFNPGRIDRKAAPSAAIPTARGARSCAIGDLDRDGALDFYLGGIRAPAWSRGGVVFFGPAPGGPAGWGRMPLIDRRWPIWADFVDHDNDGDLDLVVRYGARASRLSGTRATSSEGVKRVVGSHAEDSSSRTGGGVALYVNGGRRILIDAGPISGIASSTAPSSLAFVDQDLDGALDLYSGQRLRRWRGERGEVGDTDAHHGVILLLRSGSKGNRDCIGCQVELRTARGRQLRVVGPSGGIPNGPPGMVHFGMGHEIRVERIDVQWPNGKRQTFFDLPVDQQILLRQGRGPVWRQGVNAIQLDLDQRGERSGGLLRPERQSSTGARRSPLSDGLTLVGQGGRTTLSGLLGRVGTLILLRGRGRCDRCDSVCEKIQQMIRASPAWRAYQVYPAVASRNAASRTGPCVLPKFVLQDAGAWRRATPVVPAVLHFDGRGHLESIHGEMSDLRAIEGKIGR
jgi:hypothetical protein